MNNVLTQNTGVVNLIGYCSVCISEGNFTQCTVQRTGATCAPLTERKDDVNHVSESQQL